MKIPVVLKILVINTKITSNLILEERYAVRSADQSYVSVVRIHDRIIQYLAFKSPGPCYMSFWVVRTICV